MEYSGQKKKYQNPPFVLRLCLKGSWFLIKISKIVILHRNAAYFLVTEQG